MTAAQKTEWPVVALVNPETGAEFHFRGRWLRGSPATLTDVKKGRAKFVGDKVYLNMPQGVQAQFDKGILQLVSDHEARQQLEEASGLRNEPVPQPAGNASRETWISYAVSQGMSYEEASALGRDQIRARFAQPVFDPDAPPDMAQLNENP